VLGWGAVVAFEGFAQHGVLGWFVRGLRVKGRGSRRRGGGGRSVEAGNDGVVGGGDGTGYRDGSGGGLHSSEEV